MLKLIDSKQEMLLFFITQLHFLLLSLGLLVSFAILSNPVTERSLRQYRWGHDDPLRCDVLYWSEVCRTAHQKAPPTILPFIFPFFINSAWQCSLFSFPSLSVSLNHALMWCLFTCSALGFVMAVAASPLLLETGDARINFPHGFVL